MIMMIIMIIHNGGVAWILPFNLYTYATLTHLPRFSTQTRFLLGHWPNQKLNRSNQQLAGTSWTTKRAKDWFLTAEAGCTCWYVWVGELIWGGENSGMEQNDPTTHSNNKTEQFKKQNQARCIGDFGRSGMVLGVLGWNTTTDITQQ